MPGDDEILDPAHDPANNTGVTEVGAAGIPPPEKTEDKVTADGNLLERGGVKYVRAEALHNERVERQKLASILADLDPVMPEFEQFLKQRNGRQQSTVERARAPQHTNIGDSDYTADELEGFAITRGYYKDDNVTPDGARAARELDIISGISKRQVAAGVRPLAEGSARDRAAANRAAANGKKFVDGQPIADQKYVDAAMNALPDEYLSDPNVANITQVIAAGLEYLDMRKNGTIGRSRGRSRGDGEPMLVERGTGRFDGDDGELSALDRAAARARGKSPEEWAKLSKQVNKGRSAVEDL